MIMLVTFATLIAFSVVAPDTTFVVALVGLVCLTAFFWIEGREL